MVVPAGVVLRRPAQHPDVDVGVAVQRDVVPVAVGERDVLAPQLGSRGDRRGQGSSSSRWSRSRSGRSSSAEDPAVAVVGDPVRVAGGHLVALAVSGAGYGGQGGHAAAPSSRRGGLRRLMACWAAARRGRGRPGRRTAGRCRGRRRRCRARGPGRRRPAGRRTRCRRRRSGRRRTGRRRARRRRSWWTGARPAPATKQIRRSGSRARPAACHAHQAACSWAT